MAYYHGLYDRSLKLTAVHKIVNSFQIISLLFHGALNLYLFNTKDLMLKNVAILENRLRNSWLAHQQIFLLPQLNALSFTFLPPPLLPLFFSHSPICLLLFFNVNKPMSSVLPFSLCSCSISHFESKSHMIIRELDGSKLLNTVI